ncbi:MAG: Ig-like domain-containing protein [Candidatus Thorarchaeota archaeon]|nr:Ig-like domain-containing protein [Candidatus Thorarchaeota archaeon]
MHLTKLRIGLVAGVLLFMFVVQLFPLANSGALNWYEHDDRAMVVGDYGLNSLLQPVDRTVVPVTTPKLSPVKIVTPSNVIDFEQRKAEIFASVDHNSNKIHDSLEKTIALRESTGSVDGPVSVIVAVRDGELDDAINYFEMLGGTLTRRLEGAFYGLAGNISASKVADLANFGDVELVEENQQMVRHMDTATLLTNVRTYVWDTLGYRGDSNSAIAILDTGIDDSHTMLSPYASGDFTNGKIVGWHDATSDNSASPEDMNSHGSHCAGIAAGKEYDSQLPDGRIRTTWGIKYSLSSSASGFFSYYIQVKAAGRIDIMTLWSGGTNVGSSEVRLVAPNGTIVDSVVSTASQRNLTATINSNETGIWSVKIQVSYPSGGGEFRAVGINVYPYSTPSDSHGRFSGVAPDTKLVSVKVFDNSGSGSSTDLVDGLNWVYNNAQTYHITVASMSLGFSSTVASVDTATANLVSKGIVTAVSAGNDGQGANHINTPGHVNEVICVAASGDHNQITDYSSEGPGHLNTAKPDLAAPGGVSTQGAILSVDSNDQEADGAFSEQQSNDMALMQGTSMSCPYVAGLAALLVDAMGGYSSWTYDSTAKPYTVKQLLMMTSYEIGTINRGGKDTVEGYGRVNADAALEAYLYEHTIGTSESATIVTGDIGRKAWARHLTLTSGTTYTFNLDVPAGADFDLYLYDGSYDTYGEPILLAKSINFATGASEHITFTPSSTGTYYIVVKYIRGSGGTFTFSSQSGTSFPSVSIVTPAENAQLTGEFTVQVSASGTGLSSVSLRFWNDTWIDLTNDYNSGTGYYEYTMNVSCLESGNVTFLAKAIGSGGTSYDSSNVWVQTYSPQILLVDDDNGGTFEKYYIAALNALGFAEGSGFDRWTVSSDGSPSSATLQSYEIVIWFTSNDYQTTLTSTDQSNLQAFLTNGGKLFISGQDIGYDSNGSWETWLQTYLHGDYISDDTNAGQVNGVASDPIFDGVSYALGGGDGGGDNGYPDQISPVNGGVQCLQYAVSGSPGAAVSYSGSYRVVYFGFNFEAISYAADRVDALDRILNFLGVDAAPTLHVTSPERNSWVSSPFTVVYSASDDVSVSYVEFYLDGQYQARAVSDPVNITSDEGDHTLRVIAVDSLKQITVRQIILHVDNTDPTVTFVTPDAGAVVTSGTTVDVEVSDAHLDTVNYHWDSDSWQTFASPYDTQVPTGDGTHTLYVQATDLAGNQVTTSRQFVCDDTAPTITLVSPADGSVQPSGATVDLSISDTHLSTVYYHWDSGSWAVLPSPYDTSIPSGDGSHTLYVNATDEAGNYRQSSYSFTTDDTAPTITLVSPANNTEQSGGTTVNLDISDTHLSTVYYRWDTGSWGVLSAPYDTQIPSSEGAHTLYVNATDEAGNNAVRKYLWNVSYSGSAPIVNLTAPAAGGVQPSGTTISLNITDPDGDLSTVYYRWDTGSWAVLPSPYETTLPSGDGNHTLYVNATDSQGHITLQNFSFVTDDTSPTITLNSPADGSVINSGTVIDIGISDANALSSTLYNWDGGSNLTLSSPYDITVTGLSEGSHTLYVYAQDEAGNWGDASYTFVIDDTAPVITLNSPSDGSEIQSGTMIDLDVTDSHSVASVLYNWDGGTNTTLSSPYDVDTSGLSDGSHVLNIYAQDEAGNWAHETYSFTIDDTSPTITLNSPSDGSEIQSGTTIDLTVTDGHTLSQVLYNWDGTSNATLGSPYDVTTTGLSEGSHTLHVYAQDAAGNWASEDYTFVIDDTAPTITLDSPSDGAEIQSGTTIDLSVTDSHTIAQVLYNWDGSSNATLSAPYDVSTAGLSEATHTLHVYARDAAGNWIGTTYSFVIDDTAPSIVLNAPADGAEIISGTVIDLDIVEANTLSDVHYHWDSNTNTPLSSPYDVSTAGLSEGSHSLTVYAQDAAGNWNQHVYSFVIDDTAPVITLVSPSNGSLITSSTTIDLSITDSNTLNQVLYNWDETSNTTLSSPYDVTAAGLSEGTHWLYVYAQDAAGNEASSKYQFTVDDTAPVILLNSPSNGSEIQSGTLIDLSVTDSHLDYVWYNWDGGTNSTLTSPFDISTSGLAEGTHLLTVYAQDEAGNQAQETYPFLIDDTSPTITLLSPADGSEIKSGTIISLNISENNTLETTLYNWDGGSNSSLSSPYDVGTSGLAEGTHTLHVYAIDCAGNGQHSVYTFIIDDTAPTITLESPSDGSEIPSGTTIDLSVTDDNTIATVLYAWDGDANATLSSPYDVSTSGLSEGSHTLHIYASDAAGNWAGNTYSFVIDDTPPTISLLSPSDGSIIQSGTTVDLDVSETNTLVETLYAWDSDANSSLTAPYDVTTTGLSEASHTLYVYARDAAGNWAKSTYTFVIDDTAPQITLVTPTNGAEIQSGTTIDLDVSDTHVLSQVLFAWDGGANSSLPSPYDIDTSGLAEGSHTLDVYASDSAGNWAHEVYSFQVDDTAPTITLNAPANNSVVATGSVVDLDVSDANTLSLVQYSWDGGTLTVLSSPYDITISGLAEGGHTLGVYASDAAGNNAHRLYQFVVDDTPPTISLIGPANNTLQPSGTTVEVSIVDVHLDIVGYHWDSDAWNIWTAPYHTQTPSGDGSHSLYVEATDEAGHTTTTTIVYVIDDTQPVVVLNGPANNTRHHSGTLVDVSVSDLHLSTVYYHWDSAAWAVWSSPYDTSMPAGDGDHSLYVNATDEAGNWQYVHYLFITDDATPLVILHSPANNTVQVSGTLVNVSVSDNDLDTVRYHWDGDDWSIWPAPYDTYVPTGDGSHTLYVWINDTAGNEESVRYTFTTDDSAPVVVLIAPLNTTVHVSGTTIDLDVSDAHLSTVYLQWDGGSWTLVASPFDSLLPVGDGSHTLLVNATDEVGNSQIEQFVFVTDDTAPAIDLVHLQNGTVHQSGISVEVSVTEANAHTVEFRWDGATWQVWSTPYATILPSTDGSHTLDIRATDEAGNTATRTYVFYVDDTDPVIELDSPADHSVQPSGTSVQFTVTDTHLDYVACSWDGETWVNLTAPYSTALPSGDGSHTLQINATDTAGNTVTVKYIFTVDDTAPVLTLVSPTNGTIHQSGVDISFSILDEHLDSVRFQWDGGSWVPLSTPYTIQLPSGDGFHALVVEATDAAGHTANLHASFVTDDQAPILDTPDDVEYVEGTTGHSVEWTPHDLHAANYTVYLDGDVLAQGLWTDSEAISVSIDGLAQGTHTLSIELEDGAGNTVSDDLVVTVTPMSTSTTTTTTVTTTTPITTATPTPTTTSSSGLPDILGMSFGVFITMIGTSILIVLVVFFFAVRRGAPAGK